MLSLTPVKSAPDTELASSQMASAAVGVPCRPGGRLREILWCLAAAACGAIGGLAAPGFEQSYLAFLAPCALLILLARASEPWTSAWRGFAFGTGYNLVYLSWFLAFRPVFAQNSYVIPGELLGGIFWILVSAWQGVFISVFALLLKWLPLTGGFLPRRVSAYDNKPARPHSHTLSRSLARWQLPSFIVVPLLWVLVDRLCNTTQLLGFACSALHYSQYQNVVLLQMAPFVGGGGISAFIMLVNTSLAALVAYAFKDKAGGSSLAGLTMPDRKSLLLNSLGVALLCAGVYMYGQTRLENYPPLTAPASTNAPAPAAVRGAAAPSTTRTVVVSAIQAGANSRAHGVKPVSLFTKYLYLCDQCPPDSICIWPEWSMPVNYSSTEGTLPQLAALAAKNRQAWVVGIRDTDSQGRGFNATCAVDKNGALLPQVYYKQHLVPMGEYVPDWIERTPMRYLFFGTGSQYPRVSCGDKTVVFKLQDAGVGSLICFENAFPKLSCQAVRAGAEILADSSDNAWFKRSILSDQMISFSVFRAAENNRPFVFATALGPSVIVDARGCILKRSGKDCADVISAPVTIETAPSLFSRWCF